MLALTDGFYAAAGVIGAALVAAIASVWSARESRKISRETRSPNGRRSGDLQYDTWKRLQSVEVRVSELVEMIFPIENRQRRIEQKVDNLAAVQTDHLNLDEARFGRVFDTLGLEDDAPSP